MWEGSGDFLIVRWFGATPVGIQAIYLGCQEMSLILPPCILEIRGILYVPGNRKRKEIIFILNK